MSNKTHSFTIGSLAREANVHVETIRYYQRRGLLPEPQRPLGGIRRYSSVDIDRLKFVKTAQQLGFSLDEISELLWLEDGTQCQEARTLAELRLRDVRGRISRLKRIEHVLNEMVNQCHVLQGDVTCPLIASLYAGISEVEDQKN